MKAQEIIQALSEYGNAQTKRIYMSHGAPEPLFGVKVGDMKKLLKKVGKLQDEAVVLFDSGNADARYFAALCVDEKWIGKRELKKWAREANWYLLSEYAVAQLISETDFGWELGLELVERKQEHVACCGWATLGSWLSFRTVEQIDLDNIKQLLKRIEATVYDQPNRLQFSMCNFIVAAGCFVPELTQACLELGKRLQDLEIAPVKKGCSIPEIVEDITKVQTMGRIGKKRKRGRC